MVNRVDTPQGRQRAGKGVVKCATGWEMGGGVLAPARFLKRFALKIKPKSADRFIFICGSPGSLPLSLLHPSPSLANSNRVAPTPFMHWRSRALPPCFLLAPFPPFPTFPSLSPPFSSQTSLLSASYSRARPSVFSRAPLLSLFQNSCVSLITSKAKSLSRHLLSYPNSFAGLPSGIL